MASPGSPNKNNATTEPVKVATQLVTFWDREIDLENGYRGLSVEVTGRDKNILSFSILDANGEAQLNAGAAFTINLDDGLVVWSSLPSTAQDVDTESSQRTGYLFVTPQWIANNTGNLTLMEPPKWPRGMSL